MGKWITTGAIIGGSLGLLLLAKKLQAAPKALTWPRKVLAIGDSITSSQAYCQELSELLPSGSVTCMGLPGQGTGAILNRLKNEYQPYKLKEYTDVVVLAGVNDIASGRSLTTIESNLQAIYDYVKEAGLRVIAIQLTPWYGYKYRTDWFDSTVMINQWIAYSSAPDAVVKTFSMGDFQGRLLENYNAGDGLHLNNEGSRTLASLVIERGF